MQKEFDPEVKRLNAEINQCYKTNQAKPQPCIQPIQAKIDAGYEKVKQKDKLAKELTEKEKIALAERIAEQKKFDAAKNAANKAYGDASVKCARM
jgi:hypothetical protein